MRITYTYSDSIKPVQSLGCGYPVNMIYDGSGSRIRSTQLTSPPTTMACDDGSRPKVVQALGQRTNMVYDDGKRPVELAEPQAEEPLMVRNDKETIENHRKTP